MQEKSIVNASEYINGQRDHEIELRPQPYAHNGHRVWPIAARQHQENHANNDAAVRREKTDESPVRETIRQVRRKDGLQRATNPQKYATSNQRWFPVHIATITTTMPQSHICIGNICRQSTTPGCE